MHEYEFRLVVILPSVQYIKEFHNTFQNIKTFTIKYAKYFRCKEHKWEIKKKLDQVIMYYDGLWFKFVKSIEKPFPAWTSNEYQTFYQTIGYYQNPFTIEHRYEVQLSQNAKIYTYIKNVTECGLVFELEVQTNSKKWKSVNTSHLADYQNIFYLFRNKPVAPYNLTVCSRKRVKHTLKPIPNALVTVKHDGIFGLIYSYENYIHEMWEGNQQQTLLNQSIGNGIVFGAEKMTDGSIILLDVYQVRGVPACGVETILLEYLPSLKQYLPSHYKIQNYVKNLKDLPTDCLKCDGIIYHTLNDTIYKVKEKQTIDLLYENGYFVFGENKIATTEKLVDGVVYECDLFFKVIKPRPDRFISNSMDQLHEVMKI